MSVYSDEALPPIQPTEINGAQTSICVRHHGLIGQTGDTEGRVFWCPIGKQFWRYTKRRSSMYSPLPYPKTRII